MTHLKTEKIEVKVEPFDVNYSDEYSQFEGGVERDGTPSPEPEATWKPIKIESILRTHDENDEEDDDYLEEGEIEKEPELVAPSKAKQERQKTKIIKKEVYKKVKKRDIKYELATEKKKIPKIRRKVNQEDISDEFSCSKCSKRCVNLAGLSSHYARCGKDSNMLGNIVKSNKDIYCNDCGKYFQTIAAAKAHGMHCNQKDTDVPQTPIFICDFCGLHFPIKSRIKQHMIIEHATEAIFSCNVCGKRSAAKSIHEIHMRTHLDQKDRPFPCMQCTKNFKSKSELQKHFYGVHVPAEEKPKFKCDECPFITHKQEFLFKHKINKHIPDNEKPYQCETCSKGFVTDKEFDRHQKTHTNPKVHKCLGCERRFKSNAEMKEHYVKDHTDEHPFICEVCERGCNNRYQYRRHLKRHERELGIKLDKSVRKFNIRLEDYLPQQLE